MNKPMTHEENLQHNVQIAFRASKPDWVLQVTADKKLIVNPDIEVSEAAKVVLDMVQDTIRQQQAEIETLKADMRMLLKEYRQYWSDQQ